MGRPVYGDSKSSLGTIGMLGEVKRDHLGKLGGRLQFLEPADRFGGTRRSRRFRNKNRARERVISLQSSASPSYITEPRSYRLGCDAPA